MSENFSIPHDSNHVVDPLFPVLFTQILKLDMGLTKNEYAQKFRR